jgi:acylglycerol lipase
VYSTYPSTSDVEKILDSPQDESNEGEAKTEQEFRPKIAGAFVMCPLVNVAPASRPNMLVEGIARVIVKVAGSLPMAEAVRGELFSAQSTTLSRS